jgi:hypothetical protein
MKDIVTKIQGLDAELEALRPKIHDRVIEVAKRYVVAAHTTNRGYGYPAVKSPNIRFEWEIDSEVVRVGWSDYWSFGGHDAATFSFPVEYIWDEAAIVAYEERRTEEKESVLLQKQEAQRQQELKQLRHLQEKHTNNGGTDGSTTA